MALPKLPCEYPQLRIKRWNECFGNLPEQQQQELKKIITKIEKICEVI